jgi:tRNA-binding protein
MPDHPLTWPEFERVALHVGTIIEARPFPEARKPAYQLTLDFGPLGQRQSSAQVTDHYTPESLVGRQVLAVLNFPPKRIAGFVSECLVTGAADEAGRVVLAEFPIPVPNGARLF